MDINDQQSSNAICHVKTTEMYQLPQMDATPQLNFDLLAGEAVYHSGQSVDGRIIITNYRLYIQIGDEHYHIPLGLIEYVEHKEISYLHIFCKDARSYRCTFDSNEISLDWHGRIMKSLEIPIHLEQMFAFYHFVWLNDKNDDVIKKHTETRNIYTFNYKLFKDEMNRLNFSGCIWKITDINKNYKFCSTYPPYLIVPANITDDQLESVGKFRSSRRIPAVVWRHNNGAVIARCSQPEVGWFFWRNENDEKLIDAISKACNFDQNLQTNSMKSLNLDQQQTIIINNQNVDVNLDKLKMNDGDVQQSHSPDSLSDRSQDSLVTINAIRQPEKKILIMDARSYTTAVANRARGGGCECPDYYPNCEIQFMNLANIHSIRKSFQALRLLCASSADQLTWFSQLESTRWLQHMSGLMKAAVTLVNAIDRDARPVIVHCSDGWDRTPQIVALAELLLDPFYRTINGFRILIEREWLAFGHKFADRCGHTTGSDDQNERCPVFLQWLDCVHQLLLQYPCAFEFTHGYLVKLVQHIYSNLYGTFLCNTLKQREDIVYNKTISIWDFLNNEKFQNHLYTPPGTTCGFYVLWPKCNVRDLRLWNDIYLGGWEQNSMYNHMTSSTTTTNTTIITTTATTTTTSGSTLKSIDLINHVNMIKTRSYGDLMNIQSDRNLIKRQLSDTNLTNLLISNDLQSDNDCNDDCIYKKFLKDNYPKNNDHIMKNDHMVDDGLNLNNTEKMVKTIDTSTDTLVDNTDGFLNGFDIDSNHKMMDLNGLNGSYNSMSSLSIQPHSHTSSSNGWDNTLNSLVQQRLWDGYGYHLDDDGLMIIRSIEQERLLQIIQEHKKKEESLQKELQTYRKRLLKQVCHGCTDLERFDDNGSVIESHGSVVEGQPSAAESVPSDVSWDALDEHTLEPPFETTLWVPDHAVNCCTQCGDKFWIGRRKHHCRKCGQIFCADCSEFTTPLPSENLYEPVRVCSDCYAQVRRTTTTSSVLSTNITTSTSSTSTIINQNQSDSFVCENARDVDDVTTNQHRPCKHHDGQTSTNNQTQIAASSN